MQIRYIGDLENDEGNQLIQAYGIEFVIGDWVEVSDKLAISKLSNNKHFEVKGNEEISDDVSDDPSDFTHITDKDELERIGLELFGIDIDKRKGLAKIHAILKEAANAN